jgi:tetratricopeptide (TPR) repeat protein
MSKKKDRQRTETKKKNTTTSKSERKPELSKAKRHVFTVLTLLVPLAVLVIFELGLRAVGYGKNLRLAQRVEENGKAWWEINQDVGRRYFGLRPDFARQAEEGRIAYTKPANGYRVICLGESSMAGFPYNKNATMPGILRTYLQMLFPDREIEVVNLGIAAVNSFAVRDLMPEVIALDPDIVLIYAGHNEFYGALGVGSTFSLGSNRSLVNLYLRLLHYRTFNLLQGIIQKIVDRVKGRAAIDVTQSNPVMQQMARQQTIPYGSELFLKVGRIFEENLSDALEMAKATRVHVAVGNLVSNLKDHPPFISAPTNTLSRDERKNWREAHSVAMSLVKAEQYQAALEKFAIAARIDSVDAELAYYRAKCFFALEDTTAAARLFSRARDLDLLRFRAPDTFNVIIQRVSQKNDAPMVDVERAFRERCEGGIIGRELISEHLHPTVHGYMLMAKAFLEGLRDASLLPAPVDPHRLAALPEALAELKITILDEEIGRLRILNLTSAWPFEQPVNLTVPMDAQIEPLVSDVATQYINRQMSWPEAHLNFAQNLAKMKRHDAALAEYQTLVHEYPDEFSLYDSIGETLIFLQRYEQAMAAFSRSIQLNADSPLARAGIGKACMFLSRFQEAESAFVEAIKIDDETHGFSASYRSFIFYLLGGALTNLRRHAEAEQKFVEALRLDPGNTLAKDFLATLRAQLQKNK